MKKYISIFLSIFIFVAVSTKAKADTMNVPSITDTMVNQASPDDKYGSAWYGITQNGPNQNICTLIKFDSINLPPEGILDSAVLHIYYFYTSHNENTILQIGPNYNDITLSSESERNISWNHKPGFMTTHDYLVFHHINANPYGMKEIDITKIVKGWLQSDIINNGIYICVAPNQPQTYMRFYTKEKSDADKVPYLEVNYHAAVLGEPVHEDDTDSDMSFELLTPDGATLTDAPYTFTWEDPAGSDPAREHLTIILNKVNADSSKTQIFKQEIPIVWTRFESSIPLENGNYEWYIEAYLMDHKLFTTEKKTFTVSHESSEANNTESNGNTTEDNENTSTNNADNNSSTDQDKNNQENSKSEDKNKSSWNILGYSISKSDFIWGVLGLSVLVNIGLLFFLLGKKEKRHSDEKKSDTEKNIDAEAKTKQKKDKKDKH